MKMIGEYIGLKNLETSINTCTELEFLEFITSMSILGFRWVGGQEALDDICKEYWKYYQNRTQLHILNGRISFDITYDNMPYITLKEFMKYLSLEDGDTYFYIDVHNNRINKTNFVSKDKIHNLRKEFDNVFFTKEFAKFKISEILRFKK
ncbi:MAG: hypothetical protein M0P71_00925 [Melioribacteraceae bacterium]|nr:hypothetical protein [Melioribacteraceae bacterium]